jgi:hypothetical protein
LFAIALAKGTADVAMGGEPRDTSITLVISALLVDQRNLHRFGRKIALGLATIRWAAVIAAAALLSVVIAR